jgi:hypothetical protein
MLGVRRPTVSLVASQLQKRGLIYHHQSTMQVTDRRGPEDAACPCCGILRAEFDHLLYSRG